LAVRQQQFIGENADLLADLRIFYIEAIFQTSPGQNMTARQSSSTNDAV
jgi:hypothetical protein